MGARLARRRTGRERLGLAMLHGRCVCAAIRFTADGPPKWTSYSIAKAAAVRPARRSRRMPASRPARCAFSRARQPSTAPHRAARLLRHLRFDPLLRGRALAGRGPSPHRRLRRSFLARADPQGLPRGATAVATSGLRREFPDFPPASPHRCEVFSVSRYRRVISDRKQPEAKTVVAARRPSGPRLSLPVRPHGLLPPQQMFGVRCAAWLRPSAR